MTEWLGDIRDLYTRDTRGLTDEELGRIINARDNDLMRMSGTAHLVPVIEAVRRLREAIREEERAMKWLTAALLLFTVALFALAAVEHWQH